MTGDELLQAVWERQGFLVIGSPKPLPLGALLKNSEDAPSLRCKTPMRVVDYASRAEMNAQVTVASEILGAPITRSHGDYFYRVEAAD